MDLNLMNLKLGSARIGYASPRTPSSMGSMTDTADEQVSGHGLSLLPRDLTAEQLLSAPVLARLDQLLIEGLTDHEDEAFAAVTQS